MSRFLCIKISEQQILQGPVITRSFLKTFLLVISGTQTGTFLYLVFRLVYFFNLFVSRLLHFFTLLVPRLVHLFPLCSDWYISLPCLFSDWCISLPYLCPDCYISLPCLCPDWYIYFPCAQTGTFLYLVPRLVYFFTLCVFMYRSVLKVFEHWSHRKLTSADLP